MHGVGALANFNTHASIAAGVGLALGGYGYSQETWTATQIPIMTLVTLFGGIMPDIDADRSRSLKLVFTSLAVIAVILAVATTWDELDTWIMVCTALGVFVLIRDVARFIFRRLTVHRANWHSLMATVMVSLATASISHSYFQFSAELAWFHGLAMTIGMLVHLLLDECYSIDLKGARLKSSFGTALKPFDYHRPISTCLMLGAIVLTLPWLPAWPILFW